MEIRIESHEINQGGVEKIYTTKILMGIKV